MLLNHIITQRQIVIENLNETKWRQRAKSKWIREGDKNTRYFHAVASQHKQINSISSIQCQGIEVTEHSAKARVFFDYFCDLIGTSQTTSTGFSLQQIYDQAKLSSQEADSLLLPWTEAEITNVVRSLKGNKAPGPDGFTGKFYNTFLHILMPDLKAVFSYLNQQPLASLFPLNDSFIVLVPKKDTPLSPQDYRPISLINGVQKIYSKVMAENIKPFLDKLLSPTQTGFLKGRSILHGFHYAQQAIQAATTQRVQMATFKADITKAFDTLHWQFILDSLEARQFPQAWIRCIHNNILMGRSRVIINSVAGKMIRLKRGVRQGDPLSPYLFNLAADFLSRWIHKLGELNFLPPPFSQYRNCLLYADDTLLLLKPT